MEFIPLESPREKKNKRIEKNSKEIDSLKIGKENVWTLKGKTEKKYLKNKYREKMIEKRERKLMVRTNIKANKRQKSFNEYTNDEGYTDIKEGEEMGNGYSKGKFEKNDYKKTQDEEEEDDDDYDDYDDDDDDDEDEEENRIENEEDDEEKKERAKRRKWKKQDEKKKNRLFFKMKKRIMSDSQVKEFHPDIKQVIFPRKKKTK